MMVNFYKLNCKIINICGRYIYIYMNRKYILLPVQIVYLQCEPLVK